jgi:carbonic anhydrase/acetyltransferase-like protein (isoleucine patch superfamily)
MSLKDQLQRHLARKPDIHPSAFVASSAQLIGDVTVGENASIWYQTVLRGDINSIVVGPNSNIQDGTVVHLADDYGVEIGEFVTCGHKAMVHACKVDDEVLIGMGAIILDGAEIGAQSIIGANALITNGMKVPPGSMVLGTPAKVVRALDAGQRKSIKSWAEKYVEVSRHYLAGKYNV